MSIKDFNKNYLNVTLSDDELCIIIDSLFKNNSSKLAYDLIIKKACQLVELIEGRE